MTRTGTFALIGATLLVALLAGCAVAPVVTPEKPIEVAQYPAPGGPRGELG